MNASMPMPHECAQATHMIELMSHKQAFRLWRKGIVDKTINVGYADVNMNIRTYLKREIARAGGLRKLARSKDIDHAYLSRVVNGLQRPGDEILNAFDLEEIVTYRRVRDNNGR